MKSFSRFPHFRALAFFSWVAFSPIAIADTIDRENDANDLDVGALREWMNTKRQVSIKEIGGNLSLSGEVRTEFQKIGESSMGLNKEDLGQNFPLLSMTLPSILCWTTEMTALGLLLS